jgi:superoxide oxidase
MNNRYAAISVWLHWLMLLVMVAVYATIELRGQFPRGSEERDLIKTAHYLLGLSIFVLVWFRIVARLITPTPDRESYGKFQRISSTLMFLAFYALMIVMPLLGWAIVSGEGHHVQLFGWQLPAIIGPDKDLAHDIEEIHETIGTAGYYLVAIHAAAALFHHYVKKDQTLKRMLRFKD